MDEIMAKIHSLNEDELKILELLIDRLLLGQDQYGSWNIYDNRDYEAEILEEAIDTLHYLAAHLLRERANISDLQTTPECPLYKTALKRLIANTEGEK